MQRWEGHSCFRQKKKLSCNTVLTVSNRSYQIIKKKKNLLKFSYWARLHRDINIHASIYHYMWTMTVMGPFPYLLCYRNRFSGYNIIRIPCWLVKHCVNLTSIIVLAEIQLVGNENLFLKCLLLLSELITSLSKKER